MISRALTVLTLSTLLAAPALAQTQPDRAPTETPRTPAPTPPPRQPGGHPGGRVVDLRPRFTVGQQVKLNMDMNRKSTATGPAAPDTKEQGDVDVSMTVVLKCTSADPEEGYSLQLSIESMRFSGEMQGEQITWDSKKQGKDEVLDAMFSSILDVDIPVTMDKNGNISDVGGGVTGAMGGKLSGGDMFKGLFGPLTTRTSNTGEARVGDKWTNDDTMQAGLGTVKIRTDNTLKSAGQSMATIATKGTFSLDPTSSSQGVRLREGKLEGETKWNTADHMIESMNMKQKVMLEKRDTKTGQMTTTTETMDVKVNRVRTGR
ncbi:MAG TPA: DUF6263 family protein [Phycisphaerales bacterium]|nr:DUF6263 family protein [Phycisphaerales bacterium]